MTPLAELLAERGVTARHVAAGAGVHENTVYAAKSGQTPRRDVAEAIAGVLRVPAGRLWPQLADPDPSRLGDLPAGVRVATVLAAPASGAAGWQSRAACRRAPDPEVFWPWPPHAGGGASRVEREALVWCGSCLVLGDCRDLALSLRRVDDHGQVLGGLTASDRRRVRGAGRADTTGESP